MIDFLFVSRAFSVRSTNVKLVFLSDHCLLLAHCHLQDDQRAGKGKWILNVKLLTLEHVAELKKDYTGWRTVKSFFESPMNWWETVEGNIKRFFILKSVQKVRERRGKLSQLQKRMQKLLLLQAMGIDVTEDLQEVKSQQASAFASEASKIIFQSRVRSVEQDETCLRFFFQKVHRESSVLSSLKEEDGSVMSSQTDILRISKSFYARLYDMKPTGSTASQSFLSSITELLDDSTRERLDQPISLDELTKALKSFE
eukprot:g34739.t1